MNVIISNMIEIEDVSYEVQKHFMDKLTFDNPEYLKRVRMKIRKFGVEKTIKVYHFNAITNSLFIPIGMLPEVMNILPDAKIRFKYGNDRALDLKWNREFKLYDYQLEAMENIKKCSGVLVAPAGSGKTLMGLKYIQKLNRPAIWLTHTLDLMDQIKERAELFIENIGEIGVIGDSKCKFGDGKLLIASCQSLNNDEIISKLNDFYNVLVVDEAHHIPASSFSNVVNKLRMKYKLGLTATPDRKDELEFLMYLALGKKLHEVPRAALYEDEKLIRPRVEFIFTNYVDNMTSNTSESKAVDAGGEPVRWGEITSKLYNDEERINIIAKNIVRNISQDNFQLILSESIDYGYKVKEKVDQLIIENNYHGVRTEIVHSILNKASWVRVESRREANNLIAEKKALKYKYERGHKVLLINYTEEEFKKKKYAYLNRKKIVADAMNKKIHILFATKLAREGLDMPHLNIGHLISPRKGDSQYRNDGNALEQEIGRIMRVDKTNPSKTGVWYDYVDYECGVLRYQYYTRRKVYERIGLKMNGMDKQKHMTKIKEFLHNNNFYN